MNPEKVQEFRRRILEWGKRNLIMYPWRETRDPYRILIAEAILHRTQADQARSIYLRFIREFPTLRRFSQEDYRRMEEILRPAGLRWRIKKITEMLETLVEKYGCRVPEEYEKLRELPGVGDYIASAVRCFAFGYPEPVLDTNTVRIIGRVFGLEIRDTSRRSRVFRELMTRIVDADNPREFNYALIDFGKMVCRARDPSCNVCPLRDMCEYVNKD